MAKWKLHTRQKQLHSAANTTSAPCKLVHRQHANAKLPKNPE